MTSLLAEKIKHYYGLDLSGLSWTSELCDIGVLVCSNTSDSHKPQLTSMPGVTQNISNSLLLPQILWTDPSPAVTLADERTKIHPYISINLLRVPEI